MEPEPWSKELEARARESVRAVDEEPGTPAALRGLVDAADFLPAALAEIERLRQAIRDTHTIYCKPAWTDRGLHAPECLLYELDEEPEDVPEPDTAEARERARRIVDAAVARSKASRAPEGPAP